MLLVPSEQVGSFDSFYAEYRQPVFRYLCGKMNNAQDAEDLTADIFEYCFRQYTAFDPQKASRKTWLYVIVNSRYKNYLRSRRCFEDIEDYMDFTPSDDAPLEQAIEMEQERSALTKALERLPQKQREIVISKYFLGKSTDEIAKRLEMTPVNVRVQLYRALQKMKGYIQSEK